jgi:enterochelin esterase family protein
MNWRQMTFGAYVFALLGSLAAAQEPATPSTGVPPGQPPAQAPGPGRGRGGPAVVSPQIEPDGRVTFRILAPQATTVTVGGDINGSLVAAADGGAAPPTGPAAGAPPAPAAGTPVPPATPAAGATPQGGRGGAPPALVMTKGDNGIWSGTTVRRVRPGAWRYTFNVDGLSVVDPRNTNVTHNQTSPSSVLYVPGDFSETRNVPHGTVGLVRYVAKALGNAPREMYVYTPPGYEKGTGRYPVLYLIHGGGDTAISWATVGRAPNILDNLIAEKRAVPMIVVMPSGWTPSGGQVMTSDASKDPFNAEMMQDIIPFIEANYRTVGNPEGRALSGLSMGGIQTLNTGLTNLGTFRYVVVMSSGWTTEADREFFYKSQAAKIPTYNKELKLLWMGWGETDIARLNSLAIVEHFKSKGVEIETRESSGGHTWDNWRLYLYETAPKLFR